MRSIATRRGLLLIPLLLALALVATSTPALAAWSASGTGTASALADTMPTGGQPTASVAGANVTLQWTNAQFPSGQSVAGYVVYRANATTGAPATVGSGCSGVVAATTCTEDGVPAGQWVYRIAPVQHNWSGAEGSPSSTVVVS